MQLWDVVFLFMPTILDAILIFDFFKQFMMQFFELSWSGEPEEDSKDNKRSELFCFTYMYYVDFCNIFRHLSAILNF